MSLKLGALAAVLVAVIAVSMHRIYMDLTASTPTAQTSPSSSSDGEESQSLFRILGPVDTIDCAAAVSVESCISAVARSRVPVVLKGTPADTWGAREKWVKVTGKDADGRPIVEADIDYLSSRVGGDLPGVREGRDRGTRLFTPGQDKEGFLPDALGRKDSTTVVRDVPPREFFDGVTGRRRDGRYRFFSGLLSGLASPELEDDVEPTLPFALGSDHLATMVWISQRGCVSNTHYDRSINFVAQVAGRKRWLLFPPSEIAVLYPYPSVHRHYHQSRVDVTDPAAAQRDFPGSTAAEAFEVVLGPGDVLFVPPYWAHLVETLSLSVGVSLVTPSPEEMMHSEALWHPAPFDQSWTEPERVRYVAAYIRRLVASTDGMTVAAAGAANDSSPFIRNALVEGRWRGFAPKLAEYAGKNGLEPLRTVACRAEDEHALDAAKVKELEKCARDAVAKLNEVPDPDIRAIGLANAVEELARYAADGPVRMLEFFTGCF